MTEVTPEKKSAVLKLLAIFGFIAIVVLCVWLAVQIVKYAPTAFQSLASLAESVDTVRPMERASLDITADRSVVQSGTTVKLEWDAIPNANYTLNYSCADGVAIDLYANNGSTFITCDSSVALGTSNSVMLEVASERNRFQDVNYRISAVNSDTDEEIVAESGSLTIMNVAIPVATSTDEEVSEEDTETDETDEDEVTTPEPTEPAEPVDPTPQEPVGTPDLTARLVAVGIIDNNGIFRPRAEVDNDDPIAVQFAVTNIGSATSDVFTFYASVEGTSILTSGSEQVLQAGQLATLTLEFTTNETGRTPFGITVTSASDLTGRNNSFTEYINISD